MTIYLDWNATSPRHPDVVRAMQEAEQFAWANPSSTHQAGRRARRLMEDTRELLARTLKASPRDVVFTGGGTEANHLALNGARWLVTSRTEHPSITAQAAQLRDRGARVAFVDVEPSGRIAPEALAATLDQVLGDERPPPLDETVGGLNNENTPLVALSAVNHETGFIQPISALAEVVHERRARLHVDAVQLFGRGSLEHLEGFDSAAVASHKIRGPKGVGALVFACGWTPLPVSRGGSQERGLRPGTVDAMALVGFGAAVTRLETSVSGYERAGELGQALVFELLRRGRAPIYLHGGEEPRLHHVVNFRATGWKGDELVAALDLEGICVSSGSACSAGTAEPSAVIQAMLGREAARGAVRVSFGEGSTREDLAQLLRALERLGILDAER